MRKMRVVSFVTFLVLLNTKVGVGKEESYVTNLIENNDLLAWEAPQDLRTNFPYYWSGYDAEGRPFWIAELGRWNVRRMAELGGDKAGEFIRYIDQLAARLLWSINQTTVADGSPATKFTAVADLADYDLAQLTSVRTVRMVLSIMNHVEPVLRHMQEAYLINANFVAERMINLVRPILGSIFETIEVHGTNKAKWLPTLTKQIPLESLPPWYGGEKEYAPIKVYG